MNIWHGARSTILFALKYMCSVFYLRDYSIYLSNANVEKNFAHKI